MDEWGENEAVKLGDDIFNVLEGMDVVNGIFYLRLSSSYYIVQSKHYQHNNQSIGYIE